MSDQDSSENNDLLLSSPSSISRTSNASPKGAIPLLKSIRLRQKSTNLISSNQSNPNMLYRKAMGIFLIFFSLGPLILSFLAQFGPEDEKSEYLVALIILLCVLYLLEFLLFISMNFCPQGNKRVIWILFFTLVSTVIGLILASIAKYRMDNDEEEENITTVAIIFNFVTVFLLLLFVILFQM